MYETDFGYLTLVAGWEHAILHCARFIVAGNAFLIYEKDTSRSGLVACVVLLPIVLPMKYDFFKKKVGRNVENTHHSTRKCEGRSCLDKNVHGVVCVLIRMCTASFVS